MKINYKRLDDKKYDLIFSVEEVNNLSSGVMPFRDAYKHVAQKIMDETFIPTKRVKHTHEGSIGNLCNDQIQLKMNAIVANFNFNKVDNALSDLLQV